MIGSTYTPCSFPSKDYGINTKSTKVAFLAPNGARSGIFKAIAGARFPHSQTKFPAQGKAPPQRGLHKQMPAYFFFFEDELLDDLLLDDLLLDDLLLDEEAAALLLDELAEPPQTAAVSWAPFLPTPA